MSMDFYAFLARKIFLQRILDVPLEILAFWQWFGA